MLNDMLSFWRQFLDIVADFLGTPPVIYFVGLFMVCVIVKVFIALINIRR